MGVPALSGRLSLSLAIRSAPGLLGCGFAATAAPWSGDLAEAANRHERSLLTQNTLVGYIVLLFRFPKQATPPRGWRLTAVQPGVRKLIRSRPVVRPEDDIEYRQRIGKVLILVFGQHGVMDAVHLGSHQYGVEPA